MNGRTEARRLMEGGEAELASGLDAYELSGAATQLGGGRMGILVDLVKVRELRTVADLCFRTANDFDPKRRMILIQRGHELLTRAATLCRGEDHGEPAALGALAGLGR